MPVRIGAIEVSHWHTVYDPAYLRRLMRMPDVEIVALHDRCWGMMPIVLAGVAMPPP
jgi:hypothetical protein